MSLLPKSLQNLIEQLGNLPGVGPRTAERYANYLLRADQAQASKLGQSILDIPNNIGFCPKTFALIEKGQDLSPLYTSPERNKKIVAVVAEPFDIMAIEKTGQYHGTYHVLGGLISPLDGLGPEQLHIAELIKRVQEDNVTELILAISSGVEGESTALYLQQELLESNVKITRLARGLPAGVDIEYADQITLARALEHRTNLN